MRFLTKSLAPTKTIIVVSPIVSVFLIFLWFSINPISQDTSINASFSNPIGFLISNFVFDGYINVENIVLSCVFLLAIFFFFPGRLKTRSALFFPAIAVTSGAIAELAAALACNQACSFYGMSGVAGGIIGFTIGNYFVAFGIVFFGGKFENAYMMNEKNAKGRVARLVLPILLSSYIILLLIISGFFSIHPATGNSPFPITIQIPVSITTESQPVQVGHTTGIAIGFLLYLAVVLAVSKFSRPIRLHTGVGG